ncbi:hypothetical protein WA556_003867 [Blastocystis sp. ATCC 50177/Nand II]
MNPSTCTISGKPTVSISTTTFTVSSTVAGQQYQGTFTLQVMFCTYKTNGYYESFNIKEKASQQILLNVAYNSGQPNNEDRTYIICATGSIYVVTIDSSINYWQSSSFLLNNVEVTSSTATNNYNNILYHQISLPVKTMAIGDQPAVNYIQQGSNTIAIAIVAQSFPQTNSMFDCAASRVFDYTSSYSGINGSPSLLLNQYYGYTMYYSVTFANDRREWISSVTVYLYYTQTTQQQPGGVDFIKNVTGATWSLKGEHKKIWLENNKPYNQYRFENFASGNLSACYWKLSNAGPDGGRHGHHGAA